MRYKFLLKVNGFLFLLSLLSILLVLEKAAYNFIIIGKNYYTIAYFFYYLFTNIELVLDNWALVYFLIIIVCYLFLAITLTILSLFFIKNIKYYQQILQNKILSYHVTYNYIIITSAIIFNFSYIIFILLNHPKTSFYIYVIISLTLFSLFGIIYTMLIASNQPTDEE
jgi:hypothetical protein